MRAPSPDVCDCADATNRLAVLARDALNDLEHATDEALIALTRWGVNLPEHRD